MPLCYEDIVPQTPLIAISSQILTLSFVFFVFRMMVSPLLVPILLYFPFIPFPFPIKEVPPSAKAVPVLFPFLSLKAFLYLVLPPPC